MSGLPHDDKLLWCVVVGDANGIAPVDGIALFFSDVILDVSIPLLYSLDEIVLSADWFLKSALYLSRCFICGDSKLIQILDKVVHLIGNVLTDKLFQ